ncbi:hypothetical protein D3C76_1346790 [compost metagenome]
MDITQLRRVAAAIDDDHRENLVTEIGDWGQATFTLENGYKGIYKKDLSYMAGCFFRSVSCLNQVLFAINETFLMNEKGATAIADSFSIVPSKYSQRINEIFTLITEDQENLKKAIYMMRELIQETEKLIKSKL